MLGLALVSLGLASLSLADQGGPYDLEGPYRETAIANLPTSTNPNDTFEWTDGTDWFPVEDKTSITFTAGVAGWRISGDESSEVIFTYSRNVLFDGDTPGRGSNLQIETGFTVNTAYGGDASQSLANTIHYTDAQCGVIMNYTATVYDKDGGVAGPFNAISELFLDAPENVLNVSMTETNYIKDDWQVAVYSDTPYLEVKVGDKAPSIEADQLIFYRYCPEG